MELEYRIEYSDEEMLRTLESALERLNVFRYDVRYRQLLGEGFVEKAVRWEQDIRLAKNKPFTIVVTGDFKRGKSTLINALLGEEVVTSDVTTETVTMNRISYGVHGNEAVLSGNRRVRLTDRELKREELEKVLSQLDEPVTWLEMKRPCELLKRVTIIDTPGTGDAMKDFSPMVKEALLQADAVIYVYNVQYPISQTEQMFLKSAVLPQRYTSLLIVGNYADVLATQEQYMRMRGMLTQRLHLLLPDTEIYMLSALDELCRELELERPRGELTPVLEEQFGKFRTELERLIEEKADTVVLDRMQRLTAAMLAELREELDALEKGLEMQAEDAAAALERVRRERENSVDMQTELLQDVDRTIEAMKTEANVWMGDFMESIIEESRKLGGISADILKKYYEFYCVDLLQEAMNTCLEYHQEKMYDRLDAISNELGEKLSATFGKERTYNFRMNLDNRIWTKGDTVGLATSFVSSAGLLGRVASLVADGISGTMHEKEAQDRTPELIAQIAGKLTGLNILVNETIDRLYSEMGDNAKKLIADHYESELTKAEHLVEQTMDAAKKENADKAALRTVISEAKAILDKLDVA